MRVFNRKEKILYAITDGISIPIEEVPDEVFSTKMIGEGIAIIPEKGEIYAPCDGWITMVMGTSKHAIGITNADGMELLIHVGLDTVNLLGEGFTTHVLVGDKVEKGTLLITFDREYVLEKGIALMTMMVIVNSNGYRIKEQYYHQQVLSSTSPWIIYK